MKRINLFPVGPIALFLLMTSTSLAQVGINEPDPDESSVLELTSSKRGFLAPRMTTQRREEITTPADGLLVFDTDYDMLMVYSQDEGKWHGLAPVRFNVTRNNTSVATYNVYTDDQVGNLGIGDNTPDSKLQVNGSVSIGNNNTAAPANGLYVSGAATMDAGLNVSGNVGRTSGASNTTTGYYQTTFYGKGTVPIGGIIMWRGTTPPDGWAICDGTNDTPDLSGRFIIGTGTRKDQSEQNGTVTEGSDISFALNAEGGADKITLVQAEIPSHNHALTGSVTVNSDGTHDHKFQGKYDGHDGDGDGGNSGMEDHGSGSKITTDDSGSHDHGVTNTLAISNAGSGDSFRNLPPYYALAYIMRKQ